MSNCCAVNSTNGVDRFLWMPWLVCLSAGLFFFYEFFQLTVFDVINQPLRDDFQIDATQLSWMSSTYIWADVLFLLPAGVILDRFSTRLVVLLTMTLCVLSTFGFALTHSFAWATFFHALTGFSNAFCFLACMVLAARWFPPRRQAFVVGCLVTMAFIGGMVAHTPVAYLNENYGWRNAVLIDGVIGAVILLLMSFTIRDKEGQQVAAHNAPSHLVLMKRALFNRQNLLAGLYTACLNLPILVLCALWGASYLQEVQNLSGIAASNVVSLIFVGSIFGCPLAGWISDRQGRRKPIMIIGAVVALLTLMPLLMGVVLSKALLSVVFFVLGLFTSTQVISYPVINESNGADSTGVANGIASIIIMGGGGLCQILFGWFMQQHAGNVSHYSAADFQAAMWMFPIATVFSLIAVLLMRETHCRHIEE